MCGIAGIFGKPSRDSAAAMVAALKHRGPDGDGVYVDERVALGHTRLAIIDPTANAAQPMSTAGGQVCIVFNGEIYNFRELRRRLEEEGTRFRTSSDTEVLLELYCRDGDAFVSGLRGIFAFAIYDKRGGPGRERLVLARDHLGVKPLCYALTESGMVFGSEIKALLKALPERRIEDRKSVV